MATKFLLYTTETVLPISLTSLETYLGIKFLNVETEYPSLPKEEKDRLGHLLFFITTSNAFSIEALKKSIVHKRKLITIIMRSFFFSDPVIAEDTVVLIQSMPTSDLDEFENSQALKIIKDHIADIDINSFTLIRWAKSDGSYISIPESPRIDSAMKTVATNLGLTFIGPNADTAAQAGQFIFYGAVAVPKYSSKSFIEAQNLALQSGRKIIVLLFMQDGSGTWSPVSQTKQDVFWGPIIPFYYSIQTNNISYVRNAKNYATLQILLGLYQTRK